MKQPPSYAIMKQDLLVSISLEDALRHEHKTASLPTYHDAGTVSVHTYYFRHD